ncbi:MAG: putative nucleic acid-binding Zn-ribbon protein [Glaciecola sp.]|jgi:predicted  nucleic acid-binding Zn-ribbon protein
MQDTLIALRGLQEIDRHIYRVQAELERLPKELEQRQAVLARLKEAITERDFSVKELRTRIKEIEDATSGLRQRQRKLEHESNTQKVDAALLASFQHEIRQVKRTVSQAEDDGLSLVSEADEVENGLTELEERLVEETNVFEQFQGNVAKETSAAEGKLAELMAKRDKEASGGIDAPVLDLYTKLLASRGGEALAELNGMVCQGCFVGIPRNLSVRLARRVELVQCPNCQRILYSF